jgi:anti-sigma factor RsiW
MVCLKNNTEGAEILVDYCSGGLDPARAAEIEGHIQTCADCRSLVDAQREVWSALDQWTPPEVSPGFDARLYARIGEEAGQPWWRRILRPAVPRPLWKPAIPVAAVCAAVLAVFLVRAPQPAEFTEPYGDKQVKAEVVNMDAVEEMLEDLDLLAPLGEPAEM